MFLSVKVWSARGRGCLGFEEHVNGLRFYAAQMKNRCSISASSSSSSSFGGFLVLQVFERKKEKNIDDS